MSKCPICGGGMATLFAMPNMPICEANDGSAVDQSFLYCEGCSHGKLGTIVPPETLYGHGYAATAASLGSTVGVDNFSAFIKKTTASRVFDCVVDIGGNDGSLLSHFPDQHRIAIDPNASSEYANIKQFIEDANLELMKGERALICCSHTLEHIENPEKLFAKLKEFMTDGDVCAFQFPSLDLLVRDCRIDQIYHQHMHYYSLRSISLLLAKYGFEIVAHEFDSSHYGALMIIFRKGLAEAHGENIKAMNIEHANFMFREQALSLNARLSSGEVLIGYGASQMFQLLNYYLPSASHLEYIVDEDEAKIGHRYANQIEVRPFHNMTGRSVLVTAFNTKMAVRSIVQKLFNMKARDVIVPFNYL